MEKPSKPKRNIWTDPSQYGTYEGPRGDPSEWAEAFKEAWNVRGAKNIIKEESAWTILGVVDGSDWNAIKTAFRKLMKIHHPDHGGDTETCKKMIAAYTLLKEQFDK